MKRILNTFKYGSAETKRLLAVTFLAGFAALGFLITAIVTQNMLWFFAMVIAVFITISLAQTFGIHEEDASAPVKFPETPSVDNVTSEGAKMTEAPQVAPTASKEQVTSSVPETVDIANVAAPSIDDLLAAYEEEDEDDEDDSLTEAQKIKKRKKKMKRKKKLVKKVAKLKKTGAMLETPVAKMVQAPQEEQQETMVQVPQEEQQGAMVQVSQEEQPVQMAQMTALEGEYTETAEVEEIEEIETESEDAESKPKKKVKAVEEDNKSSAVVGTEQKEEVKVEVVQASEEELATYDKRKVKKMMHKYKVKRDHRLVIVDKCEKFSIYQTPAYIWVADNMFHLLLIEQEPRHITLPVYNIHEINYLKKQTANEDVDYAAFKGKNMMAELFRPYLPDYAHSTVVDDLTAYKNLYGVGPGIYFTNRSASSLFDLLAVDLNFEDKVTTSAKVNVFFKDAYKANILLRDNVVDANGYADKISSILDAMAHSTISYAEFKDTLNLMQKNKLITSEFAMYYMGVRDKL